MSPTNQSKFTFKPDRGAIYRLETETADRLAGRAAQSVQARARRFAPKATGELAVSINVNKVASGPKTAYQIGSSVNYAGYQEFGTGPIYAKPGGVLRFKVGGRTVFATKTSGVPATHFMKRAGQGINLADFTT
jgi:HK97 gp10 family phage protein